MPEPPAEKVVLAVDIGGTKMACGFVGVSGRLFLDSQVPTPAGGDSSRLFDSLTLLVSRTLARGVEEGVPEPLACGVGCGGPMTEGGGEVSPVNIGGWRGFPLRARLSEVVDVVTFVDNDAKALALGEGWIGAAAGCSDFVAMVVSTGVGGGIVLDGHLLDGGRGNAGHIGHVNVEPDGHLCGCGAYGCLEAEASGTAIAKITGRPARDAGPEVVERTGTLVGRAVGSVSCLLDLRLAVVAGSVALGFGAPFFEAAQREIDARARIEFAAGTEIRPGGLGAGGPLIGAGAVGWRGLGHEVLSRVPTRTTS